MEAIALSLFLYWFAFECPGLVDGFISPHLIQIDILPLTLAFTTLYRKQK
jgi:hypothetical protein